MTREHVVGAPRGRCLVARRGRSRGSCSALGQQQGGGPPPEGLVSQFSGHRVADTSFATASLAPLVWIQNSAVQDCPLRFEALAGDDQSESSRRQKRGQVGRGEGAVGYVEVSRMGSVRTSCGGHLDVYPVTATPGRPHWEEPRILLRSARHL